MTLSDDSTFCLKKRVRAEDFLKAKLCVELNGCLVQLSLKSKLMISLRYLAHLYLNDVLVCIGMYWCKIISRVLVMHEAFHESEGQGQPQVTSFTVTGLSGRKCVCVFNEEFQLNKSVKEQHSYDRCIH